MPKPHNTANDNFDYERLVELVREREMVYNPAHKSYKDAGLIKNIWFSIGKTLGVTGEQAKRKWWSKRDRYKKLRNKKTRSGQAATADQERWKYFNILTFLDPYVEDNETEGNLSYVGSDESADESVTESRSRSTAVNQSTITNRSTSPETDESIDTLSDTYSKTNASTTKPLPNKEKKTSYIGGKRKRKGRHSPDPIDKLMMEMLQCRKKRRQENENDVDGDSLFMQSCLFQLKKLPEKVRTETKIEIMSLIYRKQYSTNDSPSSNMYYEGLTSYQSHNSSSLYQYPTISMYQSQNSPAYPAACTSAYQAPSSTLPKTSVYHQTSSNICQGTSSVLYQAANNSNSSEASKLTTLQPLRLEAPGSKN